MAQHLSKASKFGNELGDHDGPHILGVFIDPLKPSIGFPVHALGLFRKHIIDAAIAAKPFPDLLGPRDLPLPRCFGLGVIAQPVALAAIEPRPAIEDQATPVASWAKEPLPLSAEIQFGPVKMDGLFDLLPFFLAMVAHLVVKHQEIAIGDICDAARRLAAMTPV